MFGFGGSSISTPLLRIFFLIPPYYALASPLPMTVLSSSVASARYYKENLIEWKVVWNLLLFIVPGSVLGAYLTKYISGKVLMLLTAIFLLYISLRFILRRDIRRIRKVEKRYLIIPAGFFIGFISGLLANGGGIFVVPVLFLLGMNLKKAIASSLVVVLLGVIPSIIVHAYLGHINWLLTLFLTIGAIPSSYVGASLTVKMDRAKLQFLYGLFLFLFSIYFAIFEIIVS
ncbi:MAG: sulfite exporter TauE/SafE family protein [Thermoplasmata archaeon]|nr:sulfite exporter TauE/SafE family protein [Thermoplasmata archaeon]